jgi:hypothetical protein
LNPATTFSSPITHCSPGKEEQQEKKKREEGRGERKENEAAREALSNTRKSRLTFTSGAVSGKTMVVQSTNTGGDLGLNQFDLLMPGGGVGIFDGCAVEYGASLPGAQYGGVSSEAQCASFPAALVAGCDWRFDWFEGADNPGLAFEQVQCPAELVAKSGCLRDDDSSFPAFDPSSVPSSGSSGSSSSSSTGAATATSTATSTTSAASGGSTGTGM